MHQGNCPYKVYPATRVPYVRYLSVVRVVPCHSYMESYLITFLMFFSRNVPMLCLFLNFLLHIFLTPPLRIIPYPTVGKLPMSNRSLKKDALTTLVIIDLYL